MCRDEDFFVFMLQVNSVLIFFDKAIAMLL